MNERTLFETLKEKCADGDFSIDVDKDIINNLNPNLKLRYYQEEVFAYFKYFYENDSMRKNRNQDENLHLAIQMATGSGKTLVMAGLILYLYKKGYRNFLFFVSRDQIVKKTIENFTERSSNKYLFSENIVIDGKKVVIKTVDNFENSDKSNINICFTTIQSLFSNIWNIKENKLSYYEFDDKDIVFIADEAHHNFADSKSEKIKSQEINNINQELEKISKEKVAFTDEKIQKSWQYTIDNCFNRNANNILLDFSATLESEKNEELNILYKKRLLYDYELKQYRKDGYSKEIITIASKISVLEKAILALCLSEYRQLAFEKIGVKDVKPVVLIKSDKIKSSEDNQKALIKELKKLNAKRIAGIFNKIRTKEASIVTAMIDFFIKNKINLDILVDKIKIDFEEYNMISTNDDKDLEKQQSILNTLENIDNPIRLIFTVNKLNEGWDVLNLFDIVKMYTNSSGGNKTTTSEAQLIGRGARYCPFIVEEEQDKYKRKYDNSLDMNLKICETMCFHCNDEVEYINKLHKELSNMGLESSDYKDIKIETTIKLKKSFVRDELYKSGYIFVNSREKKNDNDLAIKKLFPNGFIVEGIIDNYQEIKIMSDELNVKDAKDKKSKTYKISEIAEDYYNLIRSKIVSKNSISFNKLKIYYPKLKSMREFITCDKYLGGCPIQIISSNKDLVFEDYDKILNIVIGKIDSKLKNISMYKGSDEFKGVPLNKYISDSVTMKYTKLDNVGGVGHSQKDSLLKNFKSENGVTIDLTLDLSENNNKDEIKSNKWYAYDDNVGTTEEKYFVWYLSTNYIEKLYKKYEKVRLIRNEKKVSIYRKEDGKPFEPDFLLYLKEQGKDYMNIQIFIEPKGTDRVNNSDENWKENMLLSLKKSSEYKIKGETLKDGYAIDKNIVMGAPFFNHKLRMDEFKSFMDELVK